MAETYKKDQNAKDGKVQRHRQKLAERDAELAKKFPNKQPPPKEK